MDLVRAPEALVREREAATWTAWGGALPPAAYLALVQSLRNHPWPREAMATWVLRDGAGAALASCQTYRMDSRLRGVAGHAYGLGSVFTDPAQRGRGFATALLEGLGERLLQEDPLAQACLLFAEAGVSSYHRAGFRDRPLHPRVFPARAGDPAATVDSLVEEADLPAVAAGIPWAEAPFAIRPSVAQVDWQRARERILLEVTGQAPPPFRGARAGRGLALWCVDPHHRSLGLLAFHPTAPAEAGALLEAARRTAAACGLPRVLIWDGMEVPLPQAGPPPEDPPPALRPMLRPLVPGLAAGDWARIPGALRI